MSERLSIPRTELSAHSPASSAATSLHPERRQSRRAGVSLQVRLCTADFRDGTFEEVRTTENASRKAIYFFTTADRYYKGMRLRVTSPYDPKAGAANLEQHGEVVRVHRREGGYGVAVALGSMRGASSTQVVPSGAYASSPSLQSSAPLAAFQMPSRERSASEIERRVATRSPFIAPVELIDMRTGSLIEARVSDLSLRGCYIDTLNPLPQGAAVRLQIRRNEQVFDALAHVSSAHSGSGMGLVFNDITLAQSALLRGWLGESALPPEVAFTAARPSRATQITKTTQNLDANTIYAVRLVNVLLRKGVLSQSEASEILRDPAND
jgi:PilZ domain